MTTILCVDDEPAILALVSRVLERAGHEIVGADSGPAALRVLAEKPIDLVLCDHSMPGMTGIELLENMAAEGYAVPVVMLTGQASIEHAVAAVRAGAVDYVTKPFEREQLELSIAKALEVTRLRREHDTLRYELATLRAQKRLIGESRAMQEVMRTIAMGAPTRATVLVQGESGTGKELVAQALHELSDRSDGPLITLNCAALPEGLVESALFGHEKGAFTGAIQRALGAFERAHGGTLLLDEISEMRLDLQAKLLRVLQEQEIERVGGTTPIPVDVRVIATTNRDLASESAAGRFRHDLFFRLNVLPIHLPPLRERLEDIPLLAARFAARSATEMGKNVTGLAPATVDVLQRYNWPGNVRELEHAVQRAVILASEPLLGPQLFSDAWAAATAPGAAAPRTPPGRAPAKPAVAVLHSHNIAEAERLLIERALAATGGHKARAAELLGISVRTLRNKLSLA